eukprot:gnl/MRDRNA2_/MRDRNA2_29396_c1_seq1.p1 gnl/MRDRNA2_/MRDRNA2_29396_c1~~gnl/MRDRNA2_/MRDRNA2_29396_c1_seq1.p1  ORF type:complete len:917 (-),score=149.31 gnl/MRDRNA2_/MRDRNA2_29396_c1_seq1:25-2775(-)
MVNIIIGCFFWFVAVPAVALRTPLEGYNISWSIKGDSIAVTLDVATEGWVGFGISGGAGMKGADLVRIDGHGVIEDGFAMGKVAPTKDCQQDWSLLSHSVMDGQTTVVIERKLDTGDMQDRPIINNGRGTVVLMAHGEQGDKSFKYHSAHRASLRVHFFESSPKISDVTSDKNVKQIYLQASSGKVGIPYVIPYPGNLDEVTTYINVCVDIPEEASAVAYEPFITPGHEALVHHMVLFASKFSCADKDFASEEGLEGLEIVNQFSTNLWLYGPGTGTYILPGDLGLPIGGADGFKSFVNNIHYDNPNRDSGITDSSGIIVHYTAIKRKYDLGVLFVGDVGVGLHGQPVPYPGSEAPLTKHIFTCPAKYFEMTGSAGKIKLIGSSLHMHFSGEFAKTQVLDGNMKPKATWMVDVYDGSYQSHVDIPDSPIIEDGDSLRTVCAYDNKNKIHGRDRRWGFGADDEMCMDWVYFYSEDKSVVPNILKAGGRCGFPELQKVGSVHFSSVVNSRKELGVSFGLPPPGKDSTCSAVPVSSPTSPTYRIMAVGKTNFNVATLGPDDARITVLCLHGFPSTASMWFSSHFAAKLLEILGPSDSHVVAPDLRGVNRTTPKYPCNSLKCEEYSPTVITHEIAQLIKHHLKAPVHIVAHDWGGIYAYRLAIFYPDLVLSVTSANMAHPSVFTQFLKHDALQQKASEYTLMFKESDSAYQAMKPQRGVISEFEKMLMPYAPEGMQHAMREAWLHEDALKYHFYWYRGSDGFKTTDEGVTPDNMVLTVPVLQLWGEKDEYVLSRQICCMKSVAPDLRVKVFKDVDHWLFEQRGQEIAPLVANMIKDIQKADYQPSGKCCKCNAWEEQCSQQIQEVCDAKPALPETNCTKSTSGVSSATLSDTASASASSPPAFIGVALICGMLRITRDIM